MEFFSPDSEIMEFLGKTADYIYLNILCLLLSLPIVTAGPAICAKYYVSMKMARGEDVYVTKSFFKSFKENFKQASIIGVVIAIIGALLVMDWYNVIWGNSQNMNFYLKIILLIISYLVWSIAFCIFPILGYYHVSTSELVKAAVLMSLLYLPKLMLFCIATVLPILIIAWYMEWGLAIWLFTSTVEFTDPSYHLPHFYELFALWANEEDRDFWKEAARASREYLKKACNSKTGLSAEYSEYDGSPYMLTNINGRHDWYYSDAYRTIANIALDYEWFSKDTEYGKWSVEIANKLQKFFGETVADDARGIYELDGKRVEGEALHPVAITATNAQASLAADGRFSMLFAEDFWNTELRIGERRYYDNCLYMFAMLALSGKYRIY